MILLHRKTHRVAEISKSLLKKQTLRTLQDFFKAYYESFLLLKYRYCEGLNNFRIIFLETTFQKIFTYLKTQVLSTCLLFFVNLLLD